MATWQIIPVQKRKKIKKRKYQGGRLTDRPDGFGGYAALKGAYYLRRESTACGAELA